MIEHSRSQEVRNEFPAAYTDCENKRTPFIFLEVFLRFYESKHNKIASRHDSFERSSVCRHPRMIIHYTRSSAPSHIHANAIIASKRGSKMKEKGGSTALSIVNNLSSFLRQSICLSQGFFFADNSWALASWNGMKIEYIKTFFINWEST